MINIGNTVTDENVVWTVSQSLSALGNIALAGNTLKKATDDSYLVIKGGNTKGAALLLNGSDRKEYRGIAELYATKDNTSSTLRQTPDGGLYFIANTLNPDKTSDLASSAIVAKSLGTNGYIKYASGLIVQWGLTGSSTSGVKKDLSISFTSSSSYSLTVCPEYSSIVNYVVFDKTANSFTVKNDIGSIAFDFIAIGY